MADVLVHQFASSRLRKSFDKNCSEKHFRLAHRFSPTGFNPNALDDTYCHRIVSARIQVKSYPINSILGEISPRF